LKNLILYSIPAIYAGLIDCFVQARVKAAKKKFKSVSQYKLSNREPFCRSSRTEGLLVWPWRDGVRETRL
jgi:hypothetical protein